MKFHQVHLIDGTTRMINLGMIESASESQSFVTVRFMSGNVMSIFTESLMGAFNEAGVVWLKYGEPEKAEGEGEVVPFEKIEDNEVADLD